MKAIFKTCERWLSQLEIKCISQIQLALSKIGTYYSPGGSFILTTVNNKCDDFVLLVRRYCSGIGQYRVGGYYLDGFRELPGGCREFYEFYGCYYHGCVIRTDRGS